MVFRDRNANVFFGVGTFFFFLGFVVFEGLKIQVGVNMINPYVVAGFGFAFAGTMVRFRKEIGRFLKTL